MIWQKIVCVLIGYVFGLFQTGFIIGKMKHIDIRDYGSGNSGTTNAMRTLGKKDGFITFFGDALKAVFAMMLTYFLFRNGVCKDHMFIIALYTGIGAILGHNYPFYLKFKGGKGIAATAGLILAFHPYFIPVGFVLFFGVFLTTHYVSLGSLLIYVGLMTEMVICGQTGLFGAAQPVLNEMYAVTAFLTILAFYKHKENISRLLHGNERKTYLFKKNEVEAENKNK